MLSQTVLESHQINISDVTCVSDAVDLRPTLFQISGLDFDVLRPDTPYGYRLQVAVSLIGRGSPDNVSSNGTVQFTWSYVLSRDDSYSVREDVIVEAGDMNADQMTLLQVCHVIMLCLSSSFNLYIYIYIEALDSNQFLI